MNQDIMGQVAHPKNPSDLDNQWMKLFETDL